MGLAEKMNGLLDQTRADEIILDGWNGIGQSTMDAAADITGLLGTVDYAVPRWFKKREQDLKDAEFFPGETAPHVKMASDLVLAGGLAKKAYRKAFPKIDLRKLTKAQKAAIVGGTMFESAALAEDTKDYITE